MGAISVGYHSRGVLAADKTTLASNVRAKTDPSAARRGALLLKRDAPVDVDAPVLGAIVDTWEGTELGAPDGDNREPCVVVRRDDTASENVAKPNDFASAWHFAAHSMTQMNLESVEGGLLDFGQPAHGGK